MVFEAFLLIVVSTLGIYLVPSSHSDSVSPLHSEWVCWCLVYVLSKVWSYCRRGQGGLGECVGKERYKLALVIAAACLCRTLAHVEWVLPLLTPIVLCFDQDDLGLIVPASSSEKNSPSSVSVFFDKKLGFIIGLAIPSSIVLFCGSQQPTAFGFSMLFLILQSAVYYFLSKRRSITEDHTMYGMLDMMGELAVQTDAVLTMLVLLTSFPPASLVPIVFQGLFKATWWFSVIILSRQGYLKTICTVSTHSFATQQASVVQGPLAPILLVVAFVALYQSWIFLPPAAQSRKIQALLASLSVIIFICGHRPTMQWPSIGFQESHAGGNHPVEDLIREARAEFSAMVEKQSKSLQEAMQEYQRRYQRDPPPGFDRWYQMAVEANVTLIDEYDLLMQDLEPFGGISAKELHARTAKVSTARMISRMMVRDHTIKVDPDHHHPPRLTEVPLTIEWLDDFAEFLPDMDLAFNAIDEPRVIVPHGSLESSLRACPAKSAGENSSNSSLVGTASSNFEFLKNGHQNVWELVTISCPPGSPASDTRYSPPPPPSPQPTDLHFVHNASFVKDTCQNPVSSMHHGFVVNPESLYTTQELIPIWSQSKLNTFQDLIMPSVHYHSAKPGYNASNDPPWSAKLNRLYWTGSTTGGHNDRNRKDLHRHRLVDFVNSPNRTITLLNQTLPEGPWQPFQTTLSTVRHLFDVAFTKFVQCDEPTCEAMKEEYRFRDRQDADHAFKYRFVLDMDGNAWSGRYYTLLRSKSLVLKQSLFREFGDQWIIPWVHYVPISMDAAELPEVMRFLSQTPRGQRIAQEVAEEGSKWAGMALREVDLKMAAGRAVLEWGRLMDRGRDEGGECPSGRTRVGERRVEGPRR